MTESSIHRYEGICCADCTAGAALEIYCVACTVSRGFKCFRFYSFLIVGVRMWSVLIGCFHADCAGRHCEGGSCAVCVRKGDASAYNFPLIKHHIGRSRICGQGNRCTFCRFGDFSACAYCRLTVCYGDVIFSDRSILPNCSQRRPVGRRPYSFCVSRFEITVILTELPLVKNLICRRCECTFRSG